MLGVDVALLVAVLCLLPTENLCYDRSGGDEDRLEKIERKLDILTNEMDRLIQVVKRIDSQISCEGDNSTGELSSEPEPADAPVTVLEVRRELVGERVKFTVRYRPNVDGVVIQWRDFKDPVKFATDVTSTPVGDGSIETSVFLPRDDNDDDDDTDTYHMDSTRAFVAFSSPNLSHELDLELRDIEGRERDIPVPLLEIDPPDEFVYEEGEDFYFKIKESLKNEDARSEPLHQFQAHLVELDTGASVMSFGEGLMEQVEKKIFLNNELSDVKIKTSERWTSGLLNFVASSMGKANTSVVRDVALRKQVVLRPETQAGPLPPGYLEFERAPWMNYDDDGRVVQTCRDGETCGAYCTVLGEDITSLDIVKVHPDGTRQAFGDAEGEVEALITKYISYKQVTFQVNVTDTEMETFECRVSNAHGVFKTQEIVTTYQVPVTIEKAESVIELINPNAESNIRELRLTCKVRGRPEPNVTFTLNHAASYYNGLAPDEVIAHGNNEYSFIKYTSFDSEDPNGWYTRLPGKLRSASCLAQRDDLLWGYEYYEFEVADDVGK